MRYSSRFFLYAPMGLFLVIVLAAAIHWRLAADAFSRRLDALNGHALMPGVTMHFSAKEISGFPFRLDAVFSNFKITVAVTHGPWVWTSEKFAMHGLISGRNKEIFEAAGRQELRWLFAKGEKQRIAFLPASLHASSISDEKGLARFDLDLIGAGAATFTADEIQFHLRRNPAQDALDFVLKLDGLKLVHASAYGDRLVLAQLQGVIAPRTPLLPLLKGKARWQDAAEGWRTAHGSMRIVSGLLRWNKTDMRVGGTLSLDADKKPAGDLRVTANGMIVPQPLGTDPLY